MSAALVRTQAQNRTAAQMRRLESGFIGSPNGEDVGRQSATTAPPRDGKFRRSIAYLLARCHFRETPRVQNSGRPHRLSLQLLLRLELAPVRPFWRPDVYLAWPSDLLLLVEQHLLPLCQPSRHASNCEQDREEIGRERHRAVDQPRVEVDIRIELARSEVIVGERDSLQLEGDLQILVHADDLEHFIRQLLHDLGARVVALVNAVAESHQPPALATLHGLDESRNVLDAADLADHPEDLLIGAAMQRPKQRGDSR